MKGCQSPKIAIKVCSAKTIFGNSWFQVSYWIRYSLKAQEWQYNPPYQ
jgi:hypothetical protein